MPAFKWIFPGLGSNQLQTSVELFSIFHSQNKILLLCKTAIATLLNKLQATLATPHVQGTSKMQSETASDDESQFWLNTGSVSTRTCNSLT